MNIKLPDNRKFGFLFSSIFLLASFFFQFKQNTYLFIIFFFLSLIFFLISLIKPSLLFIFNRAWMTFGFFLGKIINPIIMSFIYFIILSPLAITLRLFGRDELKIKTKSVNTYWCSNNQNKTLFERQY